MTTPATAPLHILPRVDEGIWDVPGVGLVKGGALTLEYAKLALALYGAREHVLRQVAARLLHALDATDVSDLADLEGRLTAGGDDDQDDDQDDDRDALIDAAGDVRPR